MDSAPELSLPPDILQRASLRGNEYAWKIRDIPEVIEAARQANLVSVGGQLQFRLPDGGTCECYWVGVDTYKSVVKTLSWQDRVNLSASAALNEFRDLQSRYDFVAEGRSGFGAHLDAATANGASAADFMCFVWDVLSRQQAEAMGY